MRLLRPVLATLSRTASRSHGASVRRSTSPQAGTQRSFGGSPQGSTQPAGTTAGIPDEDLPF